MLFTRSALVIALTSVVLLAGCSSAPKQAVTVGTEAPASPTATATPVAQGARGLLTAVEIKAALPTAKDLGGKWTKGEIPNSSKSDDKGKDTNTYSPAACAFSEGSGIANGLSAVAKSVKASAEKEADFHIPSSDVFSSQGTNVSIASYADELDPKKLNDIAKTLQTCAEFTLTDKDGVTAKAEILPVSLPNYADSTIAYRMQFSVSFLIVILDVVQVVSGHNLITVSQSGIGKIDTKLSAKLLPKIMAALDTATK